MVKLQKHRLLLAVMALTVAGLGSSQVYATDSMVAGRTLVIRDKLEHPSERKIVWIGRDASIVTGQPGSEEDPRCAPDGSGAGGSIRFFSNGAGGSAEDTGRLELPCENWRAVGSDANPRGYKYLDREQDQGPCKTVVVNDRRVIKAVCSGKNEPLNYDLAEGVDEGMIGAVLTVGMGTVRYCTEFDDFRGKDGSDGRRFISRNSDPPGSCPTPRVRDGNGDGEVRIGCLGNSNTDPRWWEGPTWCEQLDTRFALEGLVDWTTVNKGVAGAVAIEVSFWSDAYDQLAEAIEDDADAVIFAFGTNDIRVLSASPEEVIAAYEEVKWMAEIEGLSAFIALTPPVFEPHTDPEFYNALFGELNSLIEDTFAEGEIIDFNSPMVHPDDYMNDGLHMNVSGHEKRADAAYEKLMPDS